MDEERDPRGLVPEGEFLPVSLFADMEAVITPENDDSIVLHGGGCIEGVEEAAELVVHVGDAGEVALHELLPLLVLHYPLVPVGAPVVMGVGQVVFAVGR